MTSALALLGAVLASCADSAGDQPVMVETKTGNVQITASPLPSSITTLNVSVTCTGDLAPRASLDLSKDGSTYAWSGSIGGLPVTKDCLFAGQALAGSTVIYQGTQTKTIVSGTTSVSLLLQQSGAATAFDNTVPRITSLGASAASVISYGTATFSVSATDDDLGLSYQWTADCAPASSFSSGGTTATTTWTAPVRQASPCNIEVTVTDSDGVTTKSGFPISVVNAPPQLVSFSPSGLTTFSLTPSPTPATASFSFEVSDADDTVTYAWATDCPGASVAPASGSTTVLTPGTRSSLCFVSVTATDGHGGNANRFFQVEVNP